MATTNGAPKQDEMIHPDRETLLKQVSALEEQLTEVTRQRDEAREQLANYEAMYRLWDREGVAPPRACELAEARASGITLADLIADLEAAASRAAAK